MLHKMQTLTNRSARQHHHSSMTSNLEFCCTERTRVRAHILYNPSNLISITDWWAKLAAKRDCQMHPMRFCYEVNEPKKRQQRQSVVRSYSEKLLSNPPAQTYHWNHKDMSFESFVGKLHCQPYWTRMSRLNCGMDLCKSTRHILHNSSNLISTTDWWAKRAAKRDCQMHPMRFMTHEP